MNKRTAPAVGQIVYSRNVGNAARNSPTKLTPYEVAKVGRKYFFIRGIGSKKDFYVAQFCIKSWAQKTDFSATHYLYESEQEFMDDIELESLRKEIRDAFTGHELRNIPLLKLREIKAILEK